MSEWVSEWERVGVSVCVAGDNAPDNTLSRGIVDFILNSSSSLISVVR